MQPIPLTREVYYLRYIPDKGWDVRKEGIIPALRHFREKQDAIEYGRALAEKDNTELVIPKDKERLIGFGQRTMIVLDPRLWDEDLND